MTTGEREILIRRYKALTETELPARAREERWPLRLDHCLKRVCLDWACEDCWYCRLARPAERHLDGELLQRTVQCAEEILADGLPVLRERNAMSLRWRGKTLGAPGIPASSSLG